MVPRLRLAAAPRRVVRHDSGSSCELGDLLFIAEFKAHPKESENELQHAPVAAGCSLWALLT
jgi:hypothetical protein